jgi:hypothetical protein
MGVSFICNMIRGLKGSVICNYDMGVISQAFRSVRVYHFGYFCSGVIYICLFYVINTRKIITIHVKTTCCEFRKRRRVILLYKGNNKITELRTILQRESQN